MRIRLGAVLCLVAMCACERQTVLLDAPRPKDPAVRAINVPGLSFEYPGSWMTFQDERTLGSQGPEAPGRPTPIQTPSIQDLYTAAVGLNDLSFVRVQIRSVPIPEGEYNQWRVVRQYWESQLAGSRILAEGSVRVVGLTGALWQFRHQSPAGYVTNNALIVVIQGVMEYSILCQSIPEQTTEIGRGCQQVLSTLHIG
jgi:hypothetical protein